MRYMEEVYTAALEGLNAIKKNSSAGADAETVQFIIDCVEEKRRADQGIRCQGDVIRAMSNEELATMFTELCRSTNQMMIEELGEQGVEISLVESLPATWKANLDYLNGEPQDEEDEYEE